MVKGKDIPLFNFFTQSETYFHHRSDQVKRILKVGKDKGEFGKFGQNVSFVELSNLLEHIIFSHETVGHLVLGYDHNV